MTLKPSVPEHDNGAAGSSQGEAMPASGDEPSADRERAPSAEGEDASQGREEAAPALGDGGEARGRDETAGPGAASGDEDAAQQVDVAALKAQLAEEIAAKEAAIRERDELYDRWLRLQAEFDNYRKRTRRELEESKAKGAEELVVQLLPVIDNLERAIAAAGDVQNALVEGVKLIHKQFLSILEGIGVVPIAAVGMPFDPALHEAVAYEESDTFPEGVVIEELVRGYALRGKALRPSVVKVARGSGQQGGDEQ